uniref:Integrase catalytic domain-containing protein n=1 Tax=Fagus sylvatica TaxID=28930 RepID=A0A2N9FPE1_FAGSY
MPYVQCRYCHKIGHIVYNCPTKPPKPGHSRTLPRLGNPFVVAAAKASLSTPSLSSISVSELRPLVFSMVKQFMSTFGKISSAVSGNTWYFNSACCNHMSPDSQLFSSVIPTTHAPLIQTANGSYISVSHTGSVSTPILSFSDTYLIPNLTLNLISVGQLCELGYDLWFGSSGCRVQDPRTNQVLGTGRRVGRMFELTSLHLPSTPTPPPSQVAHTASVFPLSLWHLRLGHVSVQKLRSLVFSGFLGQVKHDLVDCVSCQLAKQPALSFNNSDSFSHTSFDLIHFDIWGPSPTATVGTSQQNGRAERKHCHILDSVRAFLISASCPERFWGEAALTAVYTINCLPSSALQNVTPFERLYAARTFQIRTSILSMLFLRDRVPTTITFVFNPIPKKTKVIVVRTLSLNVFAFLVTLFSRNTPCLIPFPSLQLVPPLPFTNPSLPLFPHDTSPDPSAILPISPADSPVSPLAPPLAVNPVLDQTPDLPFADSPASPQEPAPPVDPVTDQTPLLPLHRSDWVRAPPAHLRDYSCFSAVLSLHEPHTYREACTNPLWQQAMTEELQALEKTHTWDLEYGIDYEETFAFVARITSLRSLLAIAAVHQWPLFQMDVENAFLNGDLTEEVYMQAPPGYSDYPDKVCLLRRALYGLKQAPRAWFAKFSSIVHQFGFSSSSHDTTLFIRRSDKGMILLLLYVDDIIITGDDHSGIFYFKLFLHQQFEMKDLGHLSYFLGLEVSSNSTGYYLSYAKYASDLLSHVGLIDTKVVSIPLEMNARLTPLDGTPLSDATLYHQLVGSLVYLTVTRPDIAHAVHLVSQFLSAPHSTHYAAVIHILRYIKGTMFHGLHFSAHSTLNLCAYSDANWAGDLLTATLLLDFVSFWETLLFLGALLEDMGLTHSSPTVIHCDNRSAIQIVHNDIFHERTKHIEIDCHLVCHHLSTGILHLLPVSSSNQTADIFTKTFPSGRFRDLISKPKMASVRPP